MPLFAVRINSSVSPHYTGQVPRDLTVNARVVTSLKGWVVHRLIRRVRRTDQAFRLGDGLAAQTSLNSSGHPWRSAILLTAGDKIGKLKAWYERGDFRMRRSCTRFI